MNTTAKQVAYTNSMLNIVFTVSLPGLNKLAKQVNDNHTIN